MEFTTYAERVGEKRGVKKGALKNQKTNVLRALELRFKKVPQRVSDKVSGLTNATLLNKLFDAAIRCDSLKEFEAQLPAD